MKKEYYGIGIFETKEETNIGTLWRSAMNFGADYIFTIGKRYKKQASDTTKTYRNIPLFHYKDWEDFMEHKPKDAQIVCIEQTDGATLLEDFSHPKQAVYVLGAEDYGISEEMMRGHQKLEITSPMCLNVAVAGSIVMYHRVTNLIKENQL